MLFSLNEKQLGWVLEGSRYSENVMSLFRDHYVDGIPKLEACEKNGLSKQFATKKWKEFDRLMISKCAESGLEISTVFHTSTDREAIFKYDHVSRK